MEQSTRNKSEIRIYDNYDEILNTRLLAMVMSTTIKK